MTDDSRAVTAAVLGAVAGAAVGYLLLTDRGRALRREFEETLEDAARELNGFSTTVRKAAGFATEGWRLLHEVIGEGDGEPKRFARARQNVLF